MLKIFMRKEKITKLYKKNYMMKKKLEDMFLELNMDI